MKLTNFNLDLSKYDKFQPITCFSTNKNSFLILLKIKGEVQNDIIHVKSLFFKIKHLDNDILYNKISDVKYGLSDGNLKFDLCMQVSEIPSFKNYVIKQVKDIKLNIGQSNFLEFHLNYGCKDDNSNDNGDWPCNTVTAK